MKPIRTPDDMRDAILKSIEEARSDPTIDPYTIERILDGLKLLYGDPAAQKPQGVLKAPKA